MSDPRATANGLSVVVGCVDCDTTVELPPTEGRPGVVDIAPIDDWTAPPLRCPACSSSQKGGFGWEPTDRMRSIVDEHHNDTDGLLRALHSAGLLAPDNGSGSQP